MRIRRHLSHATVVAYLALFLALGSGAYAVSQIGSHDIRNDALKSVDLRDRKAVRGIDVKRDSLRGQEVVEQTLDASRFAPIAGSEPGNCDPGSATLINCASVTVNLNRRARLLAIATGGQRSEGGPATAACQVRIDGAATALSAAPGEETTDNTSLSATNGFARTVVTPEPLAAGAHTVALACNQLAGDVRIDTPTIAAIAIAAP